VYHDFEIDDDMQLTVREFIACDKNCENFENVTDEMNQEGGDFTFLFAKISPTVLCLTGTSHKVVK
jgi:hypothetical protein